MAFLFTIESMMKFWELFQTPVGSNLYGFIGKMGELFNVSERDSTLIWQSFDVAEGSYMTKIKNNSQTILKFKCSVCGKIGGGKMAKGGDGSFYYPRKHYNQNSLDPDYCEGCFKEAIWVNVGK